MSEVTFSHVMCFLIGMCAGVAVLFATVVAIMVYHEIRGADYGIGHITIGDADDGADRSVEASK